MSQQQAIKRNMGAFAFYVFEFISFSAAAITGAAILIANPTYCGGADAVSSIVCQTVKATGILDAKNIFIFICQAILFGFGAFKKDYLLTGSAPLRLSPMIIVPWTVYFIADIISIVAPEVISASSSGAVVRSIPLILYLILAFWDKALPYSYAK